MESVFVKNSSTLGELSVTISPEDYLPVFEKELKKIATKAHIKGFRPGKTPVSVVKNMYGESILAEEINKLLNQAVDSCIKENNVEYLGELLPLNDNEDNRIEMHSKKSYHFKFQVATPSPFELNFSGISLKIYQPTLNEDDIENAIKDMAERMAEEQEAESITEDCTFIKAEATWQIEAEDEYLPKEIEVFLSPNFLKPEKFAEIIGKKINDTFELIASQDMELGENDKRFSYAFGIFDEEQVQKLKDKNVQITISSIKQRKPRELNPEFFKELFPDDNIETLEELRKKVAEIEQQELEKQFAFFNEQLAKDAVLEAHNFELPDEFMKDWLLKQNKRLIQEDLEKEYPEVSKEIRWSVIKNRVIKDNAINVEAEEVKKYATNIIISQLQQYGLYNNPEFMKAIPNIVKNYLSEDRGKNFREIYEIIMRKKVIDYMMSQMSLEKIPMHWKELDTMIKDYYQIEKDTPESSEASSS